MEKSKQKRKLFNCFPLRKSVVPSSITIDTVTLITLFTKLENAKAINVLLKNNLSLLRDNIWNHVFDVQCEKFKYSKQYHFNHTIKTNGVDVDILFVHKKLDGVEIKLPKNNKNKDIYPYIDDLGMKDGVHNKEKMMEELKKLDEKYIVAYNDPGINPDLLHMCDDNKRFYRYTVKQRLNEMGTVKNRRILRKYKKLNPQLLKAEQKIGEHTSKSCDFKKFMGYAKVKIEQNKILVEHYVKEFFRKMVFRSYINKLRSESKIVKNIKRIFGTKYGTHETDGREILLVYGDWSRKDQMRGCISVPCVGLLRRLARDFKIMHFDEYNTSCLDNTTRKKNENPKVRMKDGTTKNLHAVLESKILKEIKGKKVELSRFQNRNRNAVQNFKVIVDGYRETGERLIEYRRGKVNAPKTKNPKKGKR